MDGLQKITETMVNVVKSSCIEKRGGRPEDINIPMDQALFVVKSCLEGHGKTIPVVCDTDEELRSIMVDVARRLDRLRIETLIKGLSDKGLVNISCDTDGRLTLGLTSIGKCAVDRFK